MTAETAMRRIYRRVAKHASIQEKAAGSSDTADPDTLARIDEETADENESCVSDVADISVRWRESENRKVKKDKKGKRK